MKLNRARREDRETSKQEGFTQQQRITHASWLAPHPRFRLKKILAPVDFSESSEKAMQYAVSIAQEFGSEIILLHVVQPYPVLPELPASTDELTEAILKDANTRLNEWKARVKDVPCSAKSLVGSTASQIVEFAAQEGADLIVLGTHGRTGIAHAFLGSVAERVVRLASCPTLIVRAHERDFLVAHADDAEAQAHRSDQKPATATK